MIDIKVGDYIRSDFASFIQGTVIGMGTVGKKIPSYKIRNPGGKTEYIIKGQAELLLSREEELEGMANHYARHE